MARQIESLIVQVFNNIFGCAVTLGSYGLLGALIYRWQFGILDWDDVTVWGMVVFWPPYLVYGFGMILLEILIGLVILVVSFAIFRWLFEKIYYWNFRRKLRAARS